MLASEARETFIFVAGPAMRANGWFDRVACAPRSGTVKAHLGPGRHRYIPGWINVDANMFTATCDVWADLRSTIPFPEATVKAMYSHHVIEPLPDLELHVRAAYRCL